jgi:hypothetical protein
MRFVMGNLGRTDSKRERSEGAVGRGVAIATNDQEPWQTQPQFRADDVNDALPEVLKSEQSDAMIDRILLETADHARDFGIGDRLATAARRHIVVGDAERQFRFCDAPAAPGQLAESVE